MTVFNEKEYAKAYREKYKEKAKEYARTYYLVNREKLLEDNLERKKSRPERIMWQSAKERAMKLGLPFEIAAADILIPDTCPILGIPLFKGTGKPTMHSPSLDRLVPELGYVRGNIQVISFLANTMKSNATEEQLTKFAFWVMENYLD